MNSLINLPFTKCLIRTPYMRQVSGTGRLPEYLPGYLIACRVVLNEAIRLIVLTEEGALFDSVPPQAICFIGWGNELALREVCQWDCLGSTAECVEITSLKDWTASWVTDQGRYLFSIHFDPNEAWSRLPEQLKVFHFFEADDGNLHIRVNNELRWLCKALDQGEQMKVKPDSNMKIWRVE